ncbi:MAG TPA: HAD family hydrolase [Candidatus Dormibacteraeota bacterium]
MIFDFDGLIVDTEGPIFEVWQRIYREHGHELPREQWLTIIGTASGSFDPVLDLGRRLGEPLDAEEFNALERLYYREATAAQRLLPGIDRYLVDARRLGLRTAIASSSSRRWIDEHLERFGVGGRFETIVSREDVERTKPDPALYLVALERLSSPASRAIALEDSSNGIKAAKAAGIFTVAVPNAMTAAMDLSAADLRLESLAAMPLEDLIKRAQR